MNDDDAYYLKFYAVELDTKTLDVLKDRSIARDKFLDDLLEKGESIDIENYDLINFDIKNYDKSRISHNFSLLTKIILSFILTTKTCLFFT